MAVPRTGGGVSVETALRDDRLYHGVCAGCGTERTWLLHYDDDPAATARAHRGKASQMRAQREREYAIAAAKRASGKMGA